MRFLLIFGAFCAFAQEPPPANPQRAAAALQRETARRQAESVGATLLPSIGADLDFVSHEIVHDAGASPADPACEALPDTELAPWIDAAAKAQEIKPELIRAVMWRESASRPCAVSAKGAQGLMQLMPAVATQFGVTDPFDPRQNIEAGAKLLKQLLDKYHGQLPLALAAYNAGTAPVDAAGGIPGIPETQEFVRAITGKLSK